MKLPWVIALAAMLAGGQTASGAPDPAMAKRLCEESRKDQPAEVRALCVPKEYATTARLQLFDIPWGAAKENGRFIYTTTGARVMAWEPGPHEFLPEQRASWLWIEWEGRARMVPRKTLLAVPFPVEPALVISPQAAIHGSTEAGPFARRAGLGTILQVTQPPPEPNGNNANLLYVIENGNPSGAISLHTVRRGVSSIGAPETKYVSMMSVTVKELPEQKAKAVGTAFYGSRLEVYTGPPSILLSGFLPVVEEKKVAGYVPASELSDHAPSPDEFLLTIRKELEGGEFAAAAAISEAAAKAHPGNADLESLRRAANSESVSGAPTDIGAPQASILGQFAKLPLPPVVPAAWDAGPLEKNFLEQYASKRYPAALATARVLSRVKQNGMQPIRVRTMLYYACRGDVTRAREIVVDAGGRAPDGTDWCIAKVDLDGPCEPCSSPEMDYEPDENSTGEEIAAGEAAVAEDHYRTHVLPVQQEVDRHRAWLATFQKAAPPRPALRLRFENLLDAPTPAQAAFLYRYPYSYPVKDQYWIGAGSRGAIQVRAIPVPALRPGGQAEVWVDVPEYGSSVCGVAFAKDLQTARSMIEASPLPLPVVSARPPDFRPPLEQQKTRGPAVPGEFSTPYRACVCWRQ